MGRASADPGSGVSCRIRASRAVIAGESTDGIAASITVSSVGGAVNELNTPGTETLDNVTVNFTYSGDGISDITDMDNTGGTLTLGSGVRITDSGGSFDLGYSQLYGIVDTADTLINDGKISVSAGDLGVYYGSFENNGR
jgi:hypothetical protein